MLVQIIDGGVQEVLKALVGSIGARNQTCLTKTFLVEAMPAGIRHPDLQRP